MSEHVGKSQNEHSYGPRVQFVEQEIEQASSTRRMELFSAISELSATIGSDELVGDTRYDHQKDILRDIAEHLLEGSKEGYVELATSTGKSYMIGRLAAHFGSRGLRTLVLAPTLPIVEQLSKYVDQHLEPDASIILGRHFGTERATTENQVVVSTYLGFNQLTKTNVLGDFDIILADEAHHTLGAVTKNSLLTTQEEAVKLGFTATPDYGYNRGVNQIFNECMHTISLRGAIEGELVHPLQCMMFTTDVEIPYMDSNPEFSHHELNRLIHLKSRNEKAISLAKDFISGGMQGVIACVPGMDMEHSKLLARDLRATQVIDRNTGKPRLIRAMAVGGFQTTELQNKILEQYENGELDVLTFTKVLSEGWDSQKANFLINTCPTTSMVRITQLIGRVIRRKPGVPPAIVVDFIDKSEVKHQVTALNALDEGTYELGKVYETSKKPPTQTIQESQSYIKRLLNPQLFAELTAVDSMQLTELLMPSRENRLAFEREHRFYNAKLKKAGLGEVLKNSLGIPAEMVELVRRFKVDHEERTGEQPTMNDVDREFELVLSDPDFESVVSKDKMRRFKAVAALIIENETIDAQPSGLAVTPNVAELDRSEDPYFDADEDPVFAAYVNKERAQYVRTLLHEEMYRRQFVIERRYGLDNIQPETYDEISRHIGVTRERVRQIEVETLGSMASKWRYWPEWQRQLKTYIRSTEELTGLAATYQRNRRENIQMQLFIDRHERDIEQRASMGYLEKQRLNEQCIEYRHKIALNYRFNKLIKGHYNLKIDDAEDDDESRQSSTSPL